MIKFCWLPLLTLGAGVVPAEFVWNLSEGCDRTVPECDPFYNVYDAPTKSLLCLVGSSQPCSINTLKFKPPEMCVASNLLWIDLSLGRNWRFPTHCEVQLLSVGAKLNECSGYSIAGITTRTKNNSDWCSEDVAGLDFLPILFDDQSRAILPNGIVPDKISFLVIQSPKDFMDCWISTTVQTVLAIPAYVSVSNIGALPPALKSSLTSQEAQSLALLLSTTICATGVLGVIRKINQATIANKQSSGSATPRATSENTTLVS